MENTTNLMPEMSEKSNIVLKSLMLAKREMGSAVKTDSGNPFHKSRYASLGAHLDLCENTLDKHGLIMLQTVNGSHEKAILVATLVHPESGQWIKSYLPLPNPKGDSQGLGASITYMRRYSIGSMLGLTAEDDDGETAAGRGKHADYKKEKKEDKKDTQPCEITDQKEIPAPSANFFENNNPKRQITPAEANDLRLILSGCSPKYKEKIEMFMKKSKIESFDHLTLEIYSQMRPAMIAKGKKDA